MTRLYTDFVELYDIAFSWDLADESGWLVERLGPGARSVLEPGCGTGRMVEALARRGLDVVGIDASEQMVEYAKARLDAAGIEAQVVVADMTSFDLGRRFDGAVCPINTLLHLAPTDLSRHLERMAAHLEPGARYLVQVGVFDGAALQPGSDWQAERDGTAIRITWEAIARDLERGTERHHSRIEVIGGPRAGEVLEEDHTMTAWTPATWRAAVAASPFTEVATYDGVATGRPQVPLEHGGGLLWHELAAP